MPPVGSSGSEGTLLLSSLLHRITLLVSFCWCMFSVVDVKPARAYAVSINTSYGAIVWDLEGHPILWKPLVACGTVSLWSSLGVLGGLSSFQRLA